MKNKKAAFPTWLLIYWLIAGTATSGCVLYKNRSIGLGELTVSYAFGGIILPAVAIGVGIQWLDKNLRIELK